MANESVTWEYVQDSCDVWQVGHLCNHFAAFGWEPVTVFEAHPDVELPERIGDDLGPRMRGRPVRPYSVLFRRPVPKENADA